MLMQHKNTKEEERRNGEDVEQKTKMTHPKPGGGSEREPRISC